MGEIRLDNVADQTVLQSDYLKFKGILNYFVHILRANSDKKLTDDEKNSLGRPVEEFNGDENQAGYGYKGQRIRESYEEYRDYSNGNTMDVTINLSGKNGIWGNSCYIHWTNSRCNIVADWNDEQNDVSGLRIAIWNANNKGRTFYDIMPLIDFDLANSDEPNETLKKFYGDFLQSLIDNPIEDPKDRVQTLVDKLEKSKNIILHGAPGTGKTYIARQVAAEMIGVNESQLGNDEQYGFVQFHPSYDYTDFVEGLRPVIDNNGAMSFELRDGIFKQFCEKAANSTLINGVDNFDETWEKLISAINESDEYLMTDENTKVPATVNTRDNIKFNGPVVTKEKAKALYHGIQDKNAYINIVLQHMKHKFGLKEYQAGTPSTKDNKKYIFVIDEINRGEISKIFGELFFSVDPGYRGDPKYGIDTQYSNLHTENTKFYIPDNVYIIGTMNDIDRSVDTFDFAMRRRFRFINISAKESMDMWNNGEMNSDERQAATDRLESLNKAIESIGGLNANYDIGASYFTKLPEFRDDSRDSFEILWDDYLEPLVKEYLRGTADEEGNLRVLKAAYNLENNEESSAEVTE